MYGRSINAASLTWQDDQAARYRKKRGPVNGFCPSSAKKAPTFSKTRYSNTAANYSQSHPEDIWTPIMKSKAAGVWIWLICFSDAVKGFRALPPCVASRTFETRADIRTTPFSKTSTTPRFGRLTLDSSETSNSVIRFGDGRAACGRTIWPCT